MNCVDRLAGLCNPVKPAHLIDIQPQTVEGREVKFFSPALSFKVDEAQYTVVTVSQLENLVAVLLEKEYADATEKDPTLEPEEDTTLEDLVEYEEPEGPSLVVKSEPKFVGDGSRKLVTVDSNVHLVITVNKVEVEVDVLGGLVGVVDNN